VVSRRSGGLSIGINLNPDKACNFDCIYCQVDRTIPPVIRKVDLAVLEQELSHVLDTAINQTLFQELPFNNLPPAQRGIRDIAFSGDGEPTAYPLFHQAVEIAATAKRSRALSDTKLVLITNACYLANPRVRAALRLLDENNGEIWAKLDAGTQAYFEKVDRPNFPLVHVIANILDAARVRPIVIQSLWMRIHDEPPPTAEVQAFADRLNEIIAAGGQIKLVQVYTIARQPAESFATALSSAELHAVAAGIRRRLEIPLEVHPGIAG
jgi:wyosine [tRNA(Phe)-imidazoG37] synthetase (radical SAM superfamily)